MLLQVCHLFLRPQTRQRTPSRFRKPWFSSDLHQIIILLSFLLWAFLIGLTHTQTRETVRDRKRAWAKRFAHGRAPGERLSRAEPKLVEILFLALLARLDHISGIESLAAAVSCLALSWLQKGHLEQRELPRHPIADGIHGSLALGPRRWSRVHRTDWTTGRSIPSPPSV
ncbi:hypothetical protein LZ30DRAFT_308142 [Colletotrichum cereale]|nr:hypothetical protein LZ30DRAFT_308142 [Colletotrichum cereale]